MKTKIILVIMILLLFPQFLNSSSATDNLTFNLIADRYFNSTDPLYTSSLPHDIQITFTYINNTGNVLFYLEYTTSSLIKKGYTVDPDFNGQTGSYTLKDVYSVQLIVYGSSYDIYGNYTIKDLGQVHDLESQMSIFLAVIGIIIPTVLSIIIIKLSHKNWKKI